MYAAFSAIFARCARPGESGDAALLFCTTMRISGISRESLLTTLRVARRSSSRRMAWCLAVNGSNVPYIT